VLCAAVCVASSLTIVGAGTDDVCHVGVQLHLNSSGGSEPAYLRHARAFVEGGMADYALLCIQGLKNDERDRVIRYLAERNVRFMIQEHLPIPTKPGERGMVRHYDQRDHERIRSIAGDLFLGFHWGELDSSGLKPEDYLPKHVLETPTRRQVKAAFVERVRGELRRFKRVTPARFAHSSATLSHWLFAEAGVDILCSEIGENIPNVNMMIAANRGSARAYGRPWMIDHSTWWSPRGHAGKQVSPREGHTPWCLFTSLLSAAMGGADFVQLEVDWAAYDEHYTLRPWGRAMKNLFSLTRRIGARGNTITRFAILLGHENGWPGVGWRVGDVRGAGLFDGIRHHFMQTRDADLSLKILDVFYPGFERCGWDPEYPGFLAESPLGTLDIVPDNLPPQSYGRYAMLIALGYHRMTQALRDLLHRYVEDGGVLVCGDTLFLDEAERPIEPGVAASLIGCLVDTNEHNLIRLYQPKGVLQEIDGVADAATWVEWQGHWLRPVRLTTGRTVARLDDTSYIIENRVGSGRVFYVTALNMVGSSAQKRGQEPFLYANTLYGFLHSLAAHIGDGIRFSPWTSLERIYNEKTDGTAMLLVMNHGDMFYRRDATMKNRRGFTTSRIVAQGTWETWRPGKDINVTQTGDVLAWSFDMPPRSFILFEFSAKR
jgi:hypothetical protein